MPSYDYNCVKCNKSITLTSVKVDERDNQVCETCGELLKRSWTLGNVSVWAPTAGGYR